MRNTSIPTIRARKGPLNPESAKPKKLASANASPKLTPDTSPKTTPSATPIFTPRKTRYGSGNSRSPYNRNNQGSKQ